MSSSTNRAFGLFLFLFACCLAIQSQTIARGESQTAANQPQTTTASKTSPNVVKGTVSLKGKGIAGIVVVARLANSDGQRKPTYRGVTDQEGNYRIPNIPSGTFQIGPAAPEYIPLQESRILILTEGETVEDIDFDLIRGAVITGKVTSADRPLIEQQVTCERIETSGNSSSKAIQTDDRGAYRVFGLRPGKYRVSVSQARTFMGQSTRFNQTFYPASTDIAKAQTIEVTEGGEAKDVDITVEMNDESQDRYSVSGTIIDAAANRQPVPDMRLRLQRADERGIQPLNTVATSNSEGRFKFDEISPGKYTVVTAALVDTNLRTENTPFAVTDKDVTELTVTAVRRASISGVLVYEGVQKKAALPPLGSLFINGYVVSEGQGGRFGEAARIASDGSFHMNGLTSGLANFSLGSMFGEPKGLSISRVERDGIVQPRGLEIKGEEEITGVRLVLKYTSGVIRGSIKVANGEFPPKTQFSAWLNNRTGDVAPAQPTPIVDARGHFVIEGLADGTYEVNANVIVTLPDGSVRGFSGKQQATILDGNVTDITIPIDLTGNP